MTRPPLPPREVEPGGGGGRWGPDAGPVVVCYGLQCVLTSITRPRRRLGWAGGPESCRGAAEGRDAEGGTGWLPGAVREVLGSRLIRRRRVIDTTPRGPRAGPRGGPQRLKRDARSGQAASVPGPPHPRSRGCIPYPPYLSFYSTNNPRKQPNSTVTQSRGRAGALLFRAKRRPDSPRSGLAAAIRFDLRTIFPEVRWREGQRRGELPQRRNAGAFSSQSDKFLGG